MRYDPSFLVNLFKSKCSDTVDYMNYISHDTDMDYSKSHAESTIWAHTMLVCNNLLRDPDISDELFLAALFHDIGKCYTKKTKKVSTSKGERQKSVFYDHQKIGSLLAPDFLLSMFGEDYHKMFDCRRIIELVNLHMLFSFGFGKFEDNQYILKPKEYQQIKAMFGDQLDLYRDLLKLIKADSLGRITRESEYIATINKDKVLSDYLVEMENNPPSVKTETYGIAIFLIGLPGSGKSDIARQEWWFDKISRDKLVMEKADELGIDFNEVLMIQDLMERIEGKIHADICRYVHDKDNFVVDMENLSLHSRRNKLSLVKPSYYKKADVVIRPMSKILEAKSADGIIKHNSLQLLHVMAKKFNVPTSLEFDEIEYRFN